MAANVVERACLLPLDESLAGHQACHRRNREAIRVVVESDVGEPALSLIALPPKLVHPPSPSIGSRNMRLAISSTLHGYPGERETTPHRGDPLHSLLVGNAGRPLALSGGGANYVAVASLANQSRAIASRHASGHAIGMSVSVITLGWTTSDWCTTRARPAPSLRASRGAR